MAKFATKAKKIVNIESRTSVLKITSYDETTKCFEANVDPTVVAQLCAQPHKYVWVDITDPHDPVFLQLAQDLDFHELAIEDCQKGHQRPKLEHYQHHYFLVVYDIGWVNGKAQFRELGIFLGHNYLFTVHREPVPILEKITELWHDWMLEEVLGKTTLFYLIIDAIVDAYFPLTDAMSERIDFLEDAIFKNFSSRTLSEIFQLKQQLLRVRRIATPLREVLNSLMRHEQTLFAGEAFIYLQDVYDHMIRIVEMIDIVNDRVMGAIELYLSVSGNQMNMIMKRLTSISTILMSITLIAGIYGMNFEHMPELKWQYGYVYVWGVMIVVGTGLYFYLRKVDWL
jgi:magnesium transporter